MTAPSWMQPAWSWLQARSRLGFGLELLGIYLLTFVYQTVLQFQTDFMPGTDGYYHIKIAWLYRTEGILDSKFPWAQFSFWKDTFYDKDFGFHILLMPFTYGDLVTGAKWAAVTYGSGVFVSLYAVLRLQRIRFAWLWYVVLLATGGYFGWRVGVPRPQLLAMILAIWSLHAVLIRSWKACLGLGIVFSLSYTAPFLIVVYALIVGTLYLVMEDEVDWKVPVAGLAGVMIGWLLHPHFPNNFLLTKVQIFDVLQSTWARGSTPDLHLGGELSSASSKDFLREHQVVFVVLVMVTFAMHRLSDKMKPRLVSLLALTCAWFILSCISKRFVEYFVPVSVWFCAKAISDAWPSLQQDPPRIWHKSWVQTAIIVSLSSFLVFNVARTFRENRKNHRGPKASAFLPAAQWLAKNTPKDSVIFTCDWDDAPELFHYNHRNRYMIFLDPNFMYRWDNKVWKDWDSVANGREKDPVRMLEERFKTVYGVCTGNFKDLRRQLVRHDRVRVESVGDMYVFRIAPKAPKP